MHQTNIRTGALFMQLSVLLMAFLLLMVIVLSKATAFILANFYHSKGLDTFFTWYTWLGDGAVAVLIVLVFLLLGNKLLAGKLFFSFIVSGITAQLIKNLFHAPRPGSFFSPQTYPHFIAGVTHSGMHSFPSGHTTTAFAVAATLACYYRQKTPCALFFILAAGVGYSRIYLGQHFVEDVLAGMMLGISTAILIEYLHVVIKLPKLKRYPSAIQHEQPAIEL